jgi:uncharacterized iron-regulated membrane protein
MFQGKGVGMATSVSTAAKQSWLDYRMVWRWHFYAGLFCIPFVIWLATTGSIYLFRPQIERWLDTPYEHLATTGVRKSGEAQILAALRAVPGSNLHFYQLPRGPHSAVQILVGRGREEFRVYVNPVTLQVMKVVNEDDRLMQIIFHMHGELLMGDRGSYIVELAASWAIIMILTGLFLWWPRQSSSLAGVLYPRIRSGKRLFWRDIHAVPGIWVSFFALFLLLSGLPWAKSWGGNLKLLRKLVGDSTTRQDWTTGRSSEITQRLARNSSTAFADEHAAHMAHSTSGPAAPGAFAAADTMIASVDSLHLAFPVLLSPPMTHGGNWTAKSDAQNRTLRVNVVLDPMTGAVVQRVNFYQRPWLDRVIGIGVAAHEGHLFGWLNQLVSLLTALGLIVISISAIILWWRRRPAGTLGAPLPTSVPRIAFGAIILIVALCIALPLFGLSIITTAVAERMLLRRIPAAHQWLGLSTAD